MKELSNKRIESIAPTELKEQFEKHNPIPKNNIIKNENDENEDNEESYQNDKTHYFILLKNCIFYLQIFILLCLCTNIIDISFIFLFPKAFLNIPNILALISIITSLSGCLYIFKTQFNDINASLYTSIKRILFAVISIMSFFFLDMLYVLVAKIFFGKELGWEGNFVLVPVISMMIYVTLNIVLPTLIIVKLIEIRRIIKLIGLLDGIDYSVYNIAEEYGLPSCRKNEIRLDNSNESPS